MHDIITDSVMTMQEEQLQQWAQAHRHQNSKRHADQHKCELRISVVSPHALYTMCSGQCTFRQLSKGEMFL